MNIKKIESYPYKLKFKKPFITAKGSYEYRNGFIVKIFSDSYVGLGEVSPLDKFHKESLQECYYALEAINQSISDIGLIKQEELFALFRLHALSMPSLLFGLETAVFDILSQQAELPMHKFFNSKSKNEINLNGIHGFHSRYDRFDIIKVKLGYNNLYDDIEKLEELTKVYGKKIKFRIDVNGKLDLVKAIRFCKSMENFNIDYIEQPLGTNELEDLAELRLHTKIKIAVDESLVDIESAYELIENQAADIFVIKPMVIGSYTDINEIIKMATNDNIECVITNMLDSAINRIACIHIALSNNIKSSCGISGDNLFDRDLGVTPEILGGKLSLPNLNGLGVTLND